MSDEAQGEQDEYYRETLRRELQAQGRSSPLPPWLKHPEIPRYSIGWRMGYGEDYMLLMWRWIRELSVEEKVAYFREFAPLPIDWVDWVGMQFEEEDQGEDEEGSSLSLDQSIARSGERIAGFGLFDRAAWEAALAGDSDD